MTIEYYNKLEEVDEMIDELVELKNSLIERIQREWEADTAQAKRTYDDAMNKAKLDYQSKLNYLDFRFGQSLENVLSKLGNEIPEEVKTKNKSTAEMGVGYFPHHIHNLNTGEK